MTSKTKRLLPGLLLAILAVVSMCFFAACSGDKDPSGSVTFMVQNEAGAWQQYGNTVKADENGTIQMPENPTKTYYTFVSWYESEDFADGTQFKNENISAAKTVYARFAAKEVQVYINGEDQGKQKIVDVVSGSYNPGEGLEFDGWYTDESCLVKYENTDDTSTLYAQSVARIVFDNGYETVYEAKVLPNTVMKNPAEDIIVNEDKSETTVQAAYIVKFYMDPDNVFYADETGADIDFTQPITKSMTIKVEWQSPGLAFIENPGSGNLATRLWNSSSSAANGGNTYAAVKNVIGSWPVIRIPDRTWYGTNEERALRVVDCVSAAQNLTAVTGATKIIFADGIKSIQAFNGAGITNVTEIVMPRELKIIQNSFCYFPNVIFTVPDGVEVILDSFWETSEYNGTFRGDSYIDYEKGTGVNYRAQRYGYTSYDIAIPDSVKNLSQVPSNFTFSENSAFFKDTENRIYKRDDRGLILICDYNVSDNGTLTVPEGVAGIQVGAFFNMPWIVYLKLPESWSFIGFNEDVRNYPFYYYRAAGSTSSLACYLYDETLKDNLAALHKAATMIYNNFDGTLYGSVTSNGVRYQVDGVFERVMISNTTLPEGVWVNTFGGDYTTTANFGKVCFVGKVTTGESVMIYLITKNTQTNSIALKNFSMESGSPFTLADLIQRAGITADKSVTSVKQFGEEYAFSGTVDSSLYLDVTYEFNPCGFDYEETEDGEGMIITNFNEDNAGILDSGYLIVNIPAEINSKPVVEIAANAFRGVEAISHVFIPASVRKIGDSAFENAVNLTTLKIAYGDLEYIGAHAFEDTAITLIELRTDKLTYVGPYAFKIKTLGSIFALKEDGTSGAESIWAFADGAVVGRYYAQGSALIRYSGQTTAAQYNYDHSAQEDVLVYEAQLIAIAPSYANYFTWGMGVSGRVESGLSRTDFVMRWELMEGSVYYLNTNRTASKKYPLIFGVISKVHTNAFTDMDNDYFLALTQSTVTDGNGVATTIYQSKLCFYYGQSADLNREDCWVTEQQVKTMDSAVFEEGWWEGWTAENDAENYERLQKAMESAYNYSRRCFII